MMVKTPKAIINHTRYFSMIKRIFNVGCQASDVLNSILNAVNRNPTHRNTAPSHSLRSSHLVTEREYTPSDEIAIPDCLADINAELHTETLYTIGKLLHSIDRVEEAETFRLEAHSIGQSHWKLTESAYPQYDTIL